MKSPVYDKRPTYNCNSKIIELDEDDKEYLQVVANSIIVNQNNREEVVKKLHQIIKENKVKFSFGRRDKTKYGDRSLRSLRSLFKLRNLCRTIIIGISTYYYCTNDVYELISKSFQTYGNFEQIAKLTSVGYLIDGYSSVHPLNLTINLIGFGICVMSDWQYYLMTPLGASMFQDLINNNPQAFVKMLASASLMGVSTKDILRWVPSLHINICNSEYKEFVSKIEKLEDAVVEFVINKSIVEGVAYGVSLI